MDVTSTPRCASPLLFLLSVLIVLETQSLGTAPLVIRPGVGLISGARRRRAVDPIATDEEVLIFEHTHMGSGGLVLNRPTPLRLKDLSSAARFAAFGDLPLMLGCGTCMDDGGTCRDDGDDEQCDQGSNDLLTGINDRESLAIGDLTPWFW